MILLKQSCQKICVGDEHQQIYTWRGAINAYSNFTGKDYYLSRSFRFGTVIAELANVILKLQGEKSLSDGKIAPLDFLLHKLFLLNTNIMYVLIVSKEHVVMLDCLMHDYSGPRLIQIPFPAGERTALGCPIGCIVR